MFRSIVGAFFPLVLRTIVVICFKQGHVERELDTWIINNWVLGVMYANTSDHNSMSKARNAYIDAYPKRASSSFLAASNPRSLSKHR